MKVAIIGAGASGLMLASKLSNNTNIEIHLYEKNEKVGKKMYITGKGRCNITNLCSNSDFINNIISNKKFLYSSISGFNSQDMLNFLKENNLIYNVERGNRVFPASNKSSDVIRMFSSIIDGNIKLLLNTNVTEIKKEDDKYILINNKNIVERYDKVVVATGGVSYPSTGSTGDGYKFAKNLNHKIVQVKPALCPIIIDYKPINTLSGLSLKNVKLSIKNSNNKVIKSMFGEMLFTHKGISGPIVLSISSLINRIEPINQLKAVIDLKPALDNIKLENRIIRDLEKYKEKDLKNALNDLLLFNLIPIVLGFCKIDINRKAKTLNKLEIIKIVNAIKNIELPIKSLESIDKGIVTAGGVSVKDISPTTMESKINKGLYFIGEVLDLDALTGGFNMQIAFSTAVASYKHIVKEIK